MDLVTSRGAPVFLSLSTMVSSQAVPGANCRNTFSVSTPISTVTDQDYGRVALHSMTGTHSILNIPIDITFQISSTWFNEVSLQDEIGIVDIDIPRGYYTFSAMLAFLNSNLSVFADEPYNDTVYGFGGTPIAVDPPQNIPVASSEINSSFIFTQFAGLLSQTFPGTVNEHIYKKFTLIGSPEVYRLFVTLGLTPIQNLTRDLQDILSYDILVSVSSRIFNGTNTVMTYNVENQIIAPYSYNFGGTSSLYVFLETNVNAQFRVPFTNNAPSNLIMRVPLSVPFGFQFNFVAQNLVWTQQKNLTISNLQTRVCDDFGDDIDFQNLPWFMDLVVAFAQNEDELNLSGTDGVPASIPSAPQNHFSQQSYNQIRDPFASSSQNKRKK